MTVTRELWIIQGDWKCRRPIDYVHGSCCQESHFRPCIRRCRWGDTVRILPQWLFPIKLQWLAVVAFFPFVENIWKLFLLPWTEYTNVTDRRSVGQIPRDGSGYTKHIASRGKECARCFVYWLRFVGLSAECNCVLLFVFMKCSLT